MRQWDCTYATPKEINSVKTFTGDILAITAGKGYVATAGADGSLRTWGVDKASGAMYESAVQEGAHGGRISVLIQSNGRLYTSGGDGIIRVWRPDSLELIAQVRVQPRLRRGWQGRKLVLRWAAFAQVDALALIHVPPRPACWVRSRLLTAGKRCSALPWAATGFCTLEATTTRSELGTR